MLSKQMVPAVLPHVPSELVVPVLILLVEGLVSLSIQSISCCIRGWGRCQQGSAGTNDSKVSALGPTVAFAHLARNTGAEAKMDRDRDNCIA